MALAKTRRPSRGMHGIHDFEWLVVKSHRKGTESSEKIDVRTFASDGKGKASMPQAKVSLQHACSIPSHALLEPESSSDIC